MTIPLPFVWPYAPVFWIVFAWAFYPEFSVLKGAPLRGPAPAEDRGSLRVVIFGFNLAMLAAFALPFAVPRANLPGSRALWFWLGTAVLVSGSLLRRHCFRTLGRFFTGAVTIQTDHVVIEAGAYRWVRHPSYSAALLMILGIALALGNGLGILVSCAVAFAVYSHRAAVEERALLDKIGEPYARFLATRKRFVPFIC